MSKSLSMSREREISVDVRVLAIILHMYMPTRLSYILPQVEYRTTNDAPESNENQRRDLAKNQ